jgi:uncharacterized protein YdcH (DUF465 family)
MPVKFFISYSHDEYIFKDALVNRLHEFEKKGLIEIWTDEQIVPGQEWDGTIRNALLEAVIIVFLVSQRFIRSRYIHEVELKEAIARYNNKEVILVPVILESIGQDVMEQFPLNKFEPLPVVNKKVVPVTEWTPQSGAYDNIMIGIRRMIEQLPDRKGPYAAAVHELRKLFRQARFDDVFRELDRLSDFIRSRDEGLGDTYDEMCVQYKKVKLDELQRRKGHEEKSQEFRYNLLDFITTLEKQLVKE